MPIAVYKDVKDNMKAVADYVERENAKAAE